MKFVGLIPARGGSVRVKNKNIRELAGKPLIRYSIDAALSARLLDRVVVSTDSEEIATEARKAGADVPFLRPAEISSKDATEFEFHLHALEWFQKNEGSVPDYIVNLYPTSPFRSAASIDKEVAMLQQHPEADGLRSVIKCSEHPYKMWTRDGDYLKYFVDHPDPGVHTLSYHLLPSVFIQNASIYIIKSEVVLKKRTTIGDKMLFFEMDEHESVDINNPLDFEFAEFLIRNKS
jgi:CMP-N,N'-diacetyllegionaminic acid synthase